MEIVLLGDCSESLIVKKPNQLPGGKEGLDADLVARPPAVDVLVETVMEKVQPIAPSRIARTQPGGAGQSDLRIGPPRGLVVWREADFWRELNVPPVLCRSPVGSAVPGEVALMVGREEEGCQTPLMEIVVAADAFCGLNYSLEGRGGQRQKKCHDPEDDKAFDKGGCGGVFPRTRRHE